MPLFEFNSLEPSNFVNRTAELDSLCADLERGMAGQARVCRAVMGPRRIGKTVFLQRMQDLMLEKHTTNVDVVFIDVQHIRSFGDFFDALKDAFAPSSGVGRITHKAKKGLSRIKLPTLSAGWQGATVKLAGAGITPLTWQRKGEQFFADITTIGPNLVLIIDEIGFIRDCPTNDAEKGEFIDFLRNHIQMSRCHFLLCSSFNIFQILRQYSPKNYGAWDRFLQRLEVTEFTRKQLVDDLLLPNFHDEKFPLSKPETLILAHFIATVTNGHVNTAQAIGYFLCKCFRQHTPTLAEIGTYLRETLLPDLIIADTQAVIAPIIDAEALGPEQPVLCKGLQTLARKPNPTYQWDEAIDALGKQEENLKLLIKLRYLDATQPESITFVCPFLRHHLMGQQRITQVKAEWEAAWDASA